MAAPLRVGSPAERNARARCSGPPCTTPLQLLGPRSVYRARPSATRRSLTTATARLQSLRGHPPAPAPDRLRCMGRWRRRRASGFPSSAAVQSATWSQGVNS